MKFLSYILSCCRYSLMRVALCKVLTLYCLLMSCIIIVQSSNLCSQTKLSNVGARSRHTLLISGKRVSVPIQGINSTAFVELISILNAVGAVQQPDGYVNYEINGRILRVVPGSFLVACDEGLYTRMAQMTKPTLKINKTIYVPITDFLGALHTLRLFFIETKGTQSILKTIDANSTQANELVVSTGRTSVPTINQSETHSKSSPIGNDREKIINDEVNDKEQQEENHNTLNTPPVRYKLPSDLKRRELTEPNQSKKKKDGTSLLKLSDNYLASLSLSTYINVSPNKIIRVYPEVLSNKTLLHFVGNKKLVEPNLTFVNNVLTISFPNTINVQKSLDNIRKLNVKSVRSYLEQESQVYEITLKSSDREMSVSMLTPQHAVVTIQSTDSKPNNNNQIVTVKKKKWSLDVIVLDAGHGGKDDGAESINSIKEKTIALAIAQQTQKEIRKLLPKTKVYLTRDKDTFIELDKRGQLANANEGKLFISLHCNSMPTKPNPANGYEIYVLSPARTDDAIASANRENSVIKLEADNERYAKLEDNQLIVATLAQNSFVKFSQLFANELDKELDKSTTLKSRGVNQAGFIVLIGASMPSVLIETGFLSNTNDEKYLTSTKGQTAIAKGIAKAVLAYSSKYAKMMNN
jgi:N-acetylmuramoyl-L-alanine amidase